MKKILFFIIAFLLLAVAGFSQSVIEGTDKANNGQLKRMVFIQWDDWVPDPGTDWLGLPNNMEGWLYWDVLHNPYYTGDDRRPYRLGGTFDENYASLLLQEKDDKKIADSTKAVFNTNILTYTNMSGGDLDEPWALYFGNQFNTLTHEIGNKVATLATQSPEAYAGFTGDKYYKSYLEYLDVTNDRLSTLHQSLLDKGDRIVAYLEIMKELQKQNKIMNYMMGIYIAAATRMTTMPKVNQAAKKQVIPNTDPEIVKSILSNFSF